MFDGYTDAELVGEGGLGRLYRAIRTSTGGPVAIKELRDVSSASPALHRARRELDALLKLKGHPYVVSVEEIIEGPNGPCIVMEYAPGGSLHDRVTTGPLTAPEVVLVGQHVGQALSAAHDEGIVHRDVKPHNLLVGTFGQVKVCDFGIAALLRGPAGRTQTQAFTLAYASPEEIDGDGDVGPPADAYSFSATMVHLITGRRPSFRDRIAGSGVDLSLPVGDLDPSLRSVVAALRFGLAHDAADRPQMDEFVGIFDEAASSLGTLKILRLSKTASIPMTGSRPVDVSAPPITLADDEITDRRTSKPALAVAGVSAGAGAAIITDVPADSSPTIAKPRPDSPEAIPLEHATFTRGIKGLLIAAGALFLTAIGTASWISSGGPDATAAASPTSSVSITETSSSSSISPTASTAPTASAPSTTSAATIVETPVTPPPVTPVTLVAVPPPPPNPTVSTSRDAPYGICEGGGGPCYYINISVSNFAPGAHTFYCFGGAAVAGKIWSGTITVGGTGTGSFSTSDTAPFCAAANRAAADIRVDDIADTGPGW
jgi:serine/threonine protein kinase